MTILRLRGRRAGRTMGVPGQIFTNWFPLFLLIALVLGLEPRSLVQAATFTVNSTADAVDDLPGDGVCATANGIWTLRAAIQETNALPGADTVELPAGRYELSVAGGREDACATGDLDVTDDLSIIGADAASTVIDGGKMDHVFDIFASATVSIANVTVTNGDLGFQGAYGEYGGGIRNQGTLSLNEVIVAGNNGGRDFGLAGGIYNVTPGRLILTDVAVSGNLAMHVGGVVNYGEAVLTDVTINANTALALTGGMQDGAGIPYMSPRPTAVLTNVTISGNAGGYSTASAGGFSNRDIASLTNVTITGNTGGAGAGLAG